MYPRATARSDTHETYTNAKRAAAAVQPAVSHDVIIGIILAVIAVIACAIVALLLWRLNKQSRRERRLANQVDLLGADPFVTDGLGGGLDGIGLGHQEPGTVHERWNEKPLPPRPSSALTIRVPIPAVSRRASMRALASNANVTPNFSITRSSMTPFHARTHSDDTASQSRSTSSDPFSSESSGPAQILRGQYAVVNVTEADEQRFQRPQLLYNEPDLPPGYTNGRVRGIDAPFPAKKSRKRRPASILTPVSEGAGSSIPSSWEKRGYPDVPQTPGTAYTIQVPIASATPDSPYASQRFRPPLTLSASLPLSNITVADMGPVRRQDGTKGKGRLVTMSVMVEESDTASSIGDTEEDRRASHRSERRKTQGEDGEDILGQVVERYAMDLPPYTPIHEFCTVPGASVPRSSHV